jgi:hypothetical protein
VELMQIAGGDCGSDDCPTIFMTDNDTIAVQGYLVHKETPTSEGVVEIPIAVFREAARALGR